MAIPPQRKSKTKKTMNDIIEVTGLNGITVTSTAHARTLRDSLLATAQTVSGVADQDEAEYATDVLKDIKALTRLVDTTRAAVKAPILEQGKRIDQLAKDIIEPLEDEAARISNVLGIYTAELKRKREAAEREAQAEARRMVAEAQAKEQAQRDREAAERADLEKKKSAAKNEAELQAATEAAAKAEKAAQEAQFARDLEMQQKVEAIQSAMVPTTPPKLRGLSTRTGIEFEVEDIEALYKAAPHLVTLTANKAAIKTVLKNLPKDGTLAGVRFWVESKAIVR